MKTNNGFTLLEALVSIVVLAIGLLGLAGLQTTGLKNNLSAYNKSQATLLAYEMVDRMRANVIEAKNNASSTYNTLTLTSANSQSSCIVTTGCTVVQMAENDLHEWSDELSTLLPSGTGSIVFVDPVYTITVNWDEDRDGDTDSNDPEFQLSFQL